LHPVAKPRREESTMMNGRQFVITGAALSAVSARLVLRLMT
jgi:hypothetical protein